MSIKIYLSAAHVSTLLTLFGDNSEENSKRIKYCKWKAVTIAKEAKAGGGTSGNSGGGGGDGGGISGSGLEGQDAFSGAGDSTFSTATNSNNYGDNQSSGGARIDRQPSIPAPEEAADEDADIDFG